MLTNLKLGKMKSENLRSPQQIGELSLGHPGARVLSEAPIDNDEIRDKVRGVAVAPTLAHRGATELLLDQTKHLPVRLDWVVSKESSPGLPQVFRQLVN